MVIPNYRISRLLYFPSIELHEYRICRLSAEYIILYPGQEENVVEFFPDKYQLNE